MPNKARIGTFIRHSRVGDDVGERGPMGAGRDVEHRPLNVFIVEYRFNPMTRCSCCPRNRHDIGIATY